jgi:hypothetical protein
MAVKEWIAGWTDLPELVTTQRFFDRRAPLAANQGKVDAASGVRSAGNETFMLA